MTHCEAMVSEPPHYIRKRQCLRNATTGWMTTSGVLWLCKQHYRVWKQRFGTQKEHR